MTSASAHLSRSALLFLSRQEGLKDMATRFRPFRRMASRFIAGESLEEAVDAVKALTPKGLMATRWG
jgi:proline dehydrogenase